MLVGNGGEDETPSDSGLLLGGVFKRLSDRALLPVFIKSPACRGLGFSRVNRMLRLRDNATPRVEQELSGSI